MLIKELRLLTNDLIETEVFYHTTLGFSIVEQTDSSISFSAGSTLLSFQYTNTGKPFYHFAFNIAHNKIEEALLWIESKVPVIIIAGDDKIADFKNWNAKAFYFYDNNGSILEFIARFDLPYVTNNSFGPAAIHSVSEIGLVVDEVKKQAEVLIEKHELSYFFRQPPLQHFAAVGDDSGLFIIVPENRPWYPTNKESKVYATEVFFDSGKGIEVMRIG